MRSVLFFIHVPKTAGTTVRRMLWRNLRTRLIEIPHTFHEGPIDKVLLHSWLNNDLGTRAVASHRLSIALPLDVCETFSGFSFAVIREPLDWLASHFFYTKKQDIVSFSKSKDFCSIGEFVKHLYFQRNQPNFRFPSQSRTLLRYTHDIDDDLISLLRNQKLFLLPQDQLLEGLTALSMLFPDQLRDPSIDHSNVNKRPKIPLDPDTQRMACEILASDYRLYSLAQQNLQDILGSIDIHAYQRKLRLSRIKSWFRVAILAKIQDVSVLTNNLIQSF